MDQQFELFKASVVLPDKYRLFVGIFPDAEAVEHICDLQTAQRDKFGLRGKFRPRNILHVTMHHIDDYPEPPMREIEAVSEACAAAFAGQSLLEITFDHVKSFKGRPGNQPFVLVNPGGNDSLMELHRGLITELAMRKLVRRRDKFVPHITLLYDGKEVAEQPVAPVIWQAREVALILSYLGETRYMRLRSWALNE